LALQDDFFNASLQRNHPKHEMLPLSSHFSFEAKPVVSITIVQAETGVVRGGVANQSAIPMIMEQTKKNNRLGE
jgi:hypothetical protein